MVHWPIITTMTDMKVWGFSWCLVSYRKIRTNYFIVFIHPVQWTNANPIGSDQTAKCQKKLSCITTGQAGPVLCTRQVVHHTSFLSRQCDVIASFSFDACTVQTDYLCLQIFVEYCWNLCGIHFLFESTDIIEYIDQNVFSWPKVWRLWPCYGEFWLSLFLCALQRQGERQAPMQRETRHHRL